MKLISTCLSALILFPMLSCGGGGGGPSEGTGRFVDAPVSAMTWASGDIMGTTDGNGTFFFRPSAPITFSFGNVVVGTVLGKAVLTPIDLVPGAVDETDPTVSNILRFMQTIDADGTPGNGIDGSNATSAPTGIDFTQPPATFATDTTLTALLASLPGAPTLVSAAQAQMHFQGSLFKELAGRYRGTFAGDDTGSWEVAVDINGQLIGASNSSVFGPAGATGSLTSDGTGVFGNSMLGSTFNGTVVGETINGTWSDSSDSGTFTGSRVRAGATVLDPAHLAAIVGTYPITFKEVGEPDVSGTLVVGADGLLTITAVVSPPVTASSFLYSLDASGGSFEAVDDEGTLLNGTITNAGVISGTWVITSVNESGTFANTVP